jgi:hypothetical protein
VCSRGIQASANEVNRELDQSRLSSKHAIPGQRAAYYRPALTVRATTADVGTQFPEPRPMMDACTQFPEPILVIDVGVQAVRMVSVGTQTV